MGERGSIGTTLTIVIGSLIVVAVICMVPLMNTAKRTDNISQNSLQTALTNFANEACNKGGLYEEDFDKLIQEITGPNTYDVELEVYELGENPSKKTSQAVSKKIGENVYTIYYTSQVKSIWKDNNGKFSIDEGDQIHIYAQNTNTTMGASLTSPTSGDASSIIAEATATCNKK